MTIGDEEDRRQMSLVFDALFLALGLTERCRQDADWLYAPGGLEAGDERDFVLARFQRALRIGKKAWKRYNRRASMVEGLDQVPQV